ncbi:MAG: glycosyltransferase family 39 protein, partial [bacterium]
MIKKNDFLILLVFTFVHIFILFGLKFTAWPEMFSYPYLRNNGFLIYKDMIHPYPPLLTMALSIVYKIFGYKVLTLRIFTYLLVLANDVLIFLLSKKILKKSLHSFIPLLFYVLTQPFLDGNMLWFDFATTTPILLSLFFLFEVTEKKNIKRNLVLSGIFLAIATLIKQTSGIFFVATVIFLLIKKFKLKDILLVFLGPLIMGLAFLIRLIQERAFYDFLNWTLIYPSKYWTKFPGYVRMGITRGDFLTLIILFIPLTTLLFGLKKHFKNNNFILSFLFFLCSLLTVYPRFSFFHFQLSLVIAPILFAFLLKNKFKEVSISLIIVLIIFSSRNIYSKVRIDWGKETRFFGFEEKRLSQIIQQESGK